MIAASAPGKIVLGGEYAVLEGAPAICAAVDRRARVAITPSSGDNHRVVAPGYSDIEGSFTLQSSVMHWQQGGDEYRLVEAVWCAMQPEVDASLSLLLDTRDFRETPSGEKTGIGSSAALAVALAAALGEVSSKRHDVGALAAQAHCEFQDGRGSGVDIACSFHGGVIEYRMRDRVSTPLDWPQGLHYALLWSGVAVSTRNQLSLWRASTPGPTLQRLVAAAEQLADAWRSADAMAIFDQYRGYGEALAAFGAQHELGIYDSGHAEVATAADRAGLFYKPCGAGGGDVGLVLGLDHGAVSEFAAGCSHLGFRQLAASLQAPGVRLD